MVHDATRTKPRRDLIAVTVIIDNLGFFSVVVELGRSPPRSPKRERKEKRKKIPLVKIVVMEGPKCQGAAREAAGGAAAAGAAERASGAVPVRPSCDNSRVL